MEVLNTGFYKVFKSINRYDSRQGSPYTWIRTIIVNSCLDFIKKKESRFVTHELNGEEPVYVTPEAITKMDAAALLTLIRQLPPATQAVFNLYVIDGYTHKEIGALLKISEGTSKWHLSEARKLMQQLILHGKE
jgi:RNA polymerase sigma-70 factor (ECF subfamily)